MLDENKLIEVGEFYEKLNIIAETELPIQKIYRSKGLPSHLIKKKHFNCLKHIDDISDIINNPDYVGVNPNEEGETIELIKVFDKNILIGIKLDVDENYLYISTIYEVQESKIRRRLNSGRLKKINVDKK